MDYRALLREAREALARTAEEADATKAYLLSELERHQCESRVEKVDIGSQCCFQRFPDVPLPLLEPFPSAPERRAHNGDSPHEKGEAKRNSWSEVFPSQSEVSDLPPDHLAAEIQRIGHTLGRWDESGRISAQLYKISARLLQMEDEQTAKLHELERICCSSMEAMKNEAAVARRELAEKKAESRSSSPVHRESPPRRDSILPPPHQFLRKRESEKRQHDVTKRKVPIWHNTIAKFEEALHLQPQPTH